MHEKLIADDYNSRRNKLAPHLSEASPSAPIHMSLTDASDARWHSAEKQKRLIHTAPVFAPTKVSPSPDAQSAASKTHAASAEVNSYMLRNYST